MLAKSIAVPSVGEILVTVIVFAMHSYGLSTLLTQQISTRW